MVTPALAIFVKTPELSPTKTRLAVGVGAAFARHWYRMAAAAVAEVARSGRASPVYWAVAETLAATSAFWPGLPIIEQGTGGLGTRMQRVHAELVRRHGAGLLIGADCPHLQADSLDRGCDWLTSESARLVLGPAMDGGFWLFGGNRVIDEARWSAVAYSQADTARSLQRSFADLGAWHLLETLVDVDEAPDLISCQQALAELPRPSPAQRDLYEWTAGSLLSGVNDK